MSLDVYIVTFNCGRKPVDYEHFAADLFGSYGDRVDFRLPDIIVLSLQEVAPVAYSFLGGSFLAYYFSRFVEAVRLATRGSGQYRHIATHNAGMTGILVFVKSDTASHIRWIQYGDVGIGLMGMGNKGAAAVRMAYATDEHIEPIPLTFTAAHLAAMENEVERRNMDWENIVKGLGFRSLHTVKPTAAQNHEVSNRGGYEPLLEAEKGLFTDDSPVFLAGDLNYRTGDREPGAEEYHSFPQPSTNSNDVRHFSHLFPHDQLNRERKDGKTLQLLTEEEVNFPPTYKFSEEQQRQVAKGVVVDDNGPAAWNWSKHRYPSWCDRILFSSYMASSSMFKAHAYQALPLQPTSDHRPVALAFQLDVTELTTSNISQEPPFELDKHWETHRATTRRLEIGVGLVSYLSWTWEGNGLVLASAIGAFGGWLVMQNLIAG